MISAMMRTITIRPTVMIIIFRKHVELPVRRCAHKICRVVRIASAIVLWHLRIGAKRPCHNNITSVVFCRRDVAGTSALLYPRFESIRESVFRSLRRSQPKLTERTGPHASRAVSYARRHV